MGDEAKCQMELLSPELIDRHKGTVCEIDHLCHRLGFEIGWHYILDVTWILSHLRCRAGSTILDAGAGNGVAQYALAALGYNVISVDFAPRFVPITAALMFSVEAASYGDFHHTYIDHYEKKAGRSSWDIALKRIKRLKLHDLELLLLPFMWAARVLGLRKSGKVYYYRADMKHLDMLDDDSVDAVISVSAIEHMEPDMISSTMAEFERVLKPAGKLIITTSAARDEDWFHQPSQGWCFSLKTLKDIFHLPDIAESDYSTVYDTVMNETRLSKQLQRRMPSSYRLSGDNGMPWGIWDPKYLPVGICMTKST